MSSVILTLAGPLQSWGTTKGTDKRRTGLYPTKSGVLGIVAAAMGRQRGESVDDLRGLSMAVRVDHVGSAFTDFHTAHHHKPQKAIQTHPTPLPNTLPTEREYRVDAVYTVVLSGDDGLIEQVHEAMLSPVYAPFLGRRAAVPSRPVYPRNSVVHRESIGDLLKGVQWQAPDHVKWDHHRRQKGNKVELVVVSDNDHGTPLGTVMDNPQGCNSYLPRTVTRSVVSVDVGGTRRATPVKHISISPFLNDPQYVPCPSSISHDPFALISAVKV